MPKYIKKKTKVMITEFKKGVTYTAVWDSDLAFEVKRIDHKDDKRWKMKVWWINISQTPFPIGHHQVIEVKTEHLDRYRVWGKE